MSRAIASPDTDQVARQFRAFCLQESTDRGQRLLDDVEIRTASPTDIAGFPGSQKDDGSWPDIDYADKSHSSWRPAEHLTRCLAIVVHLRTAQLDDDEKKLCLATLHQALAYWIGHDFHCPNWWYNEIGVPKMLGNIALLMEDDLQPQELKYITTVSMSRSKVGAMTGQNRVWLAANGVMRAALDHDAGLMKHAASVIADELKVGDQDEGIQPDWSFHQHGPQQQFGNYGMAFAVEMARWAAVLRGTPYALDDEKLAILRSYLLNGQNWVTWHGVMDISSCGRQLFPKSPGRKASVIRGVFRTIPTVDPAHAAEYQSFVDRNTSDHGNDLVGDKFFWRSDYLVHRQPDCMISLKMSSSRVIGGETVNNENLSGLHLADGATFIYRTGHEYDEIFPAWNWRLIPGTTALQDQSPLKWAGKNDRIMTSFVGGASDGQSSAIAMDFHRSQLAAKKAWFFSGDTVVCLGAGINCGNDAPVVTTINQTLRDGPVKLAASSLADGSTFLNDAGWFEASGTRYTSLQPQPIKISCESRSGSWINVFNSPVTPKSTPLRDLLTATIEHGDHPKDARYAYAITPSGNAADVLIDSNTADLQSVQIGQNYAAAVFWSPGGAELLGVKISTDAPCVVIYRNGKLMLADPTQKLKSLGLTINGGGQTIDVPQAGAAGSSIKIDFP